MSIALMGVSMTGQTFQAACILILHNILRTNAESVDVRDDGVSIAATHHPSMPRSTESYDSMVVVNSMVVRQSV